MVIGILLVFADLLLELSKSSETVNDIAKLSVLSEEELKAEIEL